METRHWINGSYYTSKEVQQALTNTSTSPWTTVSPEDLPGADLPSPANLPRSHELCFDASPLTLHLQLPGCGVSQHQKATGVDLKASIGIYLLWSIYCGHMRWMVRGENKQTYLPRLP